MFVIRLPKRSTRSTSPRTIPDPDSTAGFGTSRRCSAPALRPSAPRSTPFASHAAAGANRSRPSNVRLTVGRAYRRSLSSTTRFGGCSSTTRREHAVVGSDEPIVARVGRNAAPRRSDARIDDDEKDRACGKVPVGGRELEGAGEHVVRRHVVGDVDERDVGTDPENHALHRRRHSDRARRNRSAGRSRAGHAVAYRIGFGLQASGYDPKSASQAGFLKRISLRLFFSRNESETRKPPNSLMMSRLRRIA